MERIPEPNLERLERELGAMSRSLERLRQALAGLWRQPPVHVTVEKLDVERLEFRLDRIDVEELSGQLNIGLNQIWQPGGRPPDRPEPEPPEPPEPDPEPRPLWPPPREVDEE